LTIEHNRYAGSDSQLLDRKSEQVDNLTLMYVNQTTLIEYNIDLKMDEKENFFLNTQHRFIQIS